MNYYIKGEHPAKWVREKLRELGVSEVNIPTFIGNSFIYCVVDDDCEYICSEAVKATIMASSDWKEVKPTEPKPKFKGGDWIIQENIGLYKVIEVCESWYEVVDNKDNHYSIGFDKEYMCHLWSIADAKPGDVFVSGEVTFIFNKIHGVWVNCYCSLHKDGSFCEENYDLMHIKYAETIYPSTKEQRDTFFAKMKEACYEWDADKKELKKIESEKLDSDKVIEWLYDQACLGWIEDVEVDKFVDKFKKHFGL